MGKTELCLQLAEAIESPIIGADSRQIFKSLPIGTAAPTAEEQQRVSHFMVDRLPLSTPYSASQYADDALNLIDKLFKNHDALIASGGSLMYIDALRHGLDDLPTIESSIRDQLNHRLQTEGLAPLADELQQLDPQYWAVVDRQNPRRVVHALEICKQTGRSYSSFLTGKKTQRPFRIITIALCLPTEQLYDRINRRVDQMISLGLEDEARSAMPYRHHTALNTVGYKEMYEYIDGTATLPQTIENIKSHTRAYARKQLTWLRRDNSAIWFRPYHTSKIINFTLDIIHNNKI